MKTFVAIAIHDESVEVVYAGLDETTALDRIKTDYDETAFWVDGYIEIWENGEKSIIIQLNL